MSTSPDTPQQPEDDLLDDLPPAGSASELELESDSSSAENQQIIVQVNSGGVSRLVGWSLACLGWLGVLICLGVILVMSWGRSEYYDTTGGISEQYHSRDEYGDDKIAIINVVGIIAHGDGFVKRQIDRVRDDDDVKAIVVRVDSPGGTVTGSDYMYHHLKKLREEKNVPMVVSMGSIAASGGYYVSMAVGNQQNCIFAEPTTTTGSIGVIIPHYDISWLLEEHGVTNDSIASHERKQMLSMTKPIPEEHRQLLQGYVNELFELFKKRVTEGRKQFLTGKEMIGGYKIESKSGRDLATGEVFTATQAIEFGLVDKIGFIEDAIDRAAEMAGLDKDKVRVIRYKRPGTLLDLAGLAESPDPGFDLSSLLDINTPRAYYLFTSLPPLTSSYGRAD